MLSPPCAGGRLPSVGPPTLAGALQLMALNAPPEDCPAKTTMPRACTQGTTFHDLDD